MPRTLFGKSRDLSNPYATYHGVLFGEPVEYRVLKTYQHHDKEKGNPYARWLIAVKSAGTFGSWDYGDTYIRDVREGTACGIADQEWIDAYGEGITREEIDALNEAMQ